MTMTIIPNTTQEKEKPKHKRKIIRKVNKQSEPPKIKKIIRRKVNDPKKVRKIKRVVKLTPPESLVINTENVHDTNLLTNDKNNDPLKEVTQKRVTFEEDYSEDDIECVGTTETIPICLMKTPKKCLANRITHLLDFVTLMKMNFP